jgi:hypothetical protein
VSETDAPEELVPVMVPRHLLAAVYGFIAAQDSDSASASASSEEVLHRGWTAPMIVDAYRAASARMKVILDLLASQPDEKLSIKDFERALGAENEKENFVNGVLGAFGRLTNQRFASLLPNNENTWPFTVGKDVRAGDWYYEMPTKVAKVIRAIDR